MQATASPSIAEKIKSLSTDGAHDRNLYRFIDFYAVTEAAAALHHAALHHATTSARDDGAIARTLAAADAILAATVDRGLATDTATARENLRIAITSPDFRAALVQWTEQLREIASTQPKSGACTVATALRLWSMTMDYFTGADPHIIDELGEALTPLLAARCLALDVATNGTTAVAADADLRRDLCHVYAAHTAATAGTTCAELVFGYRRHLVWDAEGCGSCFDADQVDDLEAFMPGIASGARMCGDVVDSDGSHAAKAGPCASFHGLDTFMHLRRRLDGCLTGARLSKDRAVATIARSFTTQTEAR
jgi:hypothetical protein